MTKIETMLNFGEALALLKEGKKVARYGWNGENQWVSFTEGRVLDVEIDNIWSSNICALANENGGKVEIRPYMNLKTPDNKIQIGWTPSVGDALAWDWYVVE